MKNGMFIVSKNEPSYSEIIRLLSSNYGTECGDHPNEFAVFFTEEDAKSHLRFKLKNLKLYPDLAEEYSGYKLFEVIPTVKELTLD